MHTPKGADLDVQATAFLETDNGVVHYEALAHPLGHIGFLRDGWDERIEINGTGGRLEIYSAFWDHCDRKACMLVHYDAATGRATEYRYPAVSPFDHAVAFFCENIAKGQQGSQAATTGYDVDELIAAIGRSAAAGAPVMMNYRV
jgi:predicted dehydrogenase